MLNISEVDAIIIESIQAAALASSTGKAGQRGGQGGYNTLTGVIFTEGHLYGALTARYPSLPVHLVPRTAILQAFLGYWPYRKGLNVDNAVEAKLRLSFPADHFTQGNQYAPSGILGNKDKRDAYLAALYAPCHTIGIDPSATLATSTWILQRDGEPLASGKCDDLLT